MTTTNTLLTPGGAAGAVGVDFETTEEIGYYRLVWRRFCSRRVALVSAVVLAFLAFSCYILPLFLGPETVNLNVADLGPFTSIHHILGTDDDGRDLLLRNLDGGRISLLVGASAMVLTISLATVLGALSGFFGGIIDTVVTGLTNAVLSIPSILILVIFAKAFGQSVFTIVVGIALIGWPATARIVRSVILSAREKEFIEAARAVGTPRLRIITRHLIPNALGPIVVSASLTIGAAILLESALSFLGLGINPPTATWGSLLNEGRDKLSNPTGIFYSLWPGFMILLTVLSFNYIGDALRDAFDPRSLER